MDLLSTTQTGADPRLVVGAYITKGICLYRVDRKTPSQFVLEDAWTGSTIPTTASDILANYELAQNRSGT